MPQQASPRGTFAKVAEAVRAQIENDPDMRELPTLGELMASHNVSRGVVVRAYAVLREEGVAVPRSGGRWQVRRPDQQADQRPLADRLAEVITDDDLAVGARFPSATTLCARFSVSRPTVSKALDKLEAAGLLSEARQGKQRTVRALPKRTESPES